MILLKSRDIMQHGCSGYVRKLVDKAVLAEAVECVFGGETYIEQPLKDALLQYVLSPAQKAATKIRLADRRGKSSN